MKHLPNGKGTYVSTHAHRDRVSNRSGKIPIASRRAAATARVLDRQDQDNNLTPAERQEAEGLVELAEMLSLLQLRARRVTQQGPHSP